MIVSNEISCHLGASDGTGSPKAWLIYCKQHIFKLLEDKKGVARMDKAVARTGKD